MKVELREGKTERKILIGMVVSKELLSRLSDKWDFKRGLCNSKWSNIVGSWCITHYNKYGEAPLKEIETYFDNWSSKSSTDKNEIKLVGKFLDGLSGEYESVQEGINADYLTDIAAEHFNKIKLKRTQEFTERLLQSGKVEEALHHVQSFSKLEIGAGATVDVLFDRNAIRSAFENKRHAIIEFKGALGQFFGTDFCRDAFIAFSAQDKGGKSFFLQEVAWQAMLQRHNTAYFILGDMSQDQIMLRLMTRASRRPLYCKEEKKQLIVPYPTGIIHPPGEQFATVQATDKTWDKDLSWQAAWEACQKVTLMKVKSKKPKLKLQCYPGGLITVLEIQAQLSKWIRDGWSPDVVVLDYADNLAPIDGKIETRHQITATWQKLRGISQTLHCCLVTATQASRKAYGAYLMTKDMFSENKMKNALVTAMYGINQMEDEQEQDVTRLNVLVRREGRFNTRKCCFVAGCRAIGNIAVRSTW